MFEQIKACLNEEIKDEDICNEIYLNAGLMAELEAINLYKSIAAKTSNQEIEDMMLDIADEERVHVGEFKALLHDLDSDIMGLENEGKREYEEIKP